MILCLVIHCKYFYLQTFSSIIDSLVPSTSPSVYVLFHQITAWAGCKSHPNTQLGPKLTSAFFPFNLNQISTLMPHKTYTGHGQTMGTRQLKLKDIMSGCTMPFNRKSAISNTAPRVGDHGYRCYPRLAIPLTIRDFANPWWNGCNIFSRKDGMIDPPYALTPGIGLATIAPIIPVPDTPDEMVYPGDDQVDSLPNQITEAPPLEEPTPAPTTQDPAPAQVPGHDLPDATTLPVQIQHPDPDGGDLLPQEIQNVPEPDKDTPPNNANPGNNQPSGSPVNNETPPNNVDPGNNQPANNPVNNEPANSPPANWQQDSENHPVAAVSVSVIATNVITAPPAESGGENKAGAKDLPSGPEANQNLPGAGVPATQGADTSMAVDIQHLGAAGPSSIPVPAGEPGKVVYLGLTLQNGGPLATVSSLNAVLSYGPKGVIVQYPHGIESTIPVGAGPTVPGVPKNGNAEPPNTADAVILSATTSAVTTSSGQSKIKDAADIASFINYVMNGAPSPGVSAPPVLGTSSIPVPGTKPDSIPGSSSSGPTNGTGGGENLTSTSNDSTDGAVLFTGIATRGMVVMQWLSGAMIGLSIALLI